MGDSLSEWSLSGSFRIHMERVEVACKPGEPDDVRFGDRNPAGLEAVARLDLV